MDRSMPVFCFATLTMLLASCDPAVEPEPRDSYSLLQEHILSRSCAVSGCHVNGSAMARQSGLVLDAAAAYDQLVNIAPANTQAAANGLRRVTPAHPEKSFLLMKLNGHATGHEPAYGARMPLGDAPLTAGQIEFIRQWISAGAPRHGSVADEALLRDSIRTEAPFEPLAPPPAGKGFQVSTGLFDVAPHFEREIFIYRGLGNASPVYVNRIESRMRRGSHHLLLHTFRGGTPAGSLPQQNVVRDLRRPDGSLDAATVTAMEWHQFFAGSMVEQQEYSLPDGVALKLPAHASIDINSHYANTGQTMIRGEAYVNLHTIPVQQVEHVARSLFLGNEELHLPPGATTTVRKRFLFDEKTTVILLTSHMHKRGLRFTIRIVGGARNGEVVYESTDWAHPPMKSFAAGDLVLDAGEGLESEVTYRNDSPHAVGFGLTSEDEMNIILGYYF